MNYKPWKRELNRSTLNSFINGNMPDDGATRVLCMVYMNELEITITEDVCDCCGGEKGYCECVEEKEVFCHYCTAEIPKDKGFSCNGVDCCHLCFPLHVNEDEEVSFEDQMKGMYGDELNGF